MNENELLTNAKRREENMSRVEVLDKVGTLLSLPNTELYTTEMVANYYEVTTDVIKKTIQLHNDELTSNGLKSMTGKEIKEMYLGSDNISLANFKGYFTVNGSKMNNNTNRIFTKRTVLNVGMLLRDSEIAKEIRSRLLDVVHDSEKGNGYISTIVEEVSEEKQLMLDRMEAEFNGDFDKVCEINAKLFALKNKRIKELEDEVTTITTHSLTIEESSDVINRLIRIIAVKEYNNQFGKVWGDFYSKLNYKLGINVKSRTKKKEI